nr:putative ribonuclease H-like domain-containing protein [Tanacetum cinerariifolium]
MNTDHNLWKIVHNGNSKKSLRRDSKGGIIILPHVFFEEHVAVQRETKGRTLLLQSLPEDHMADFHHLDDAREIWLAVKARFGSNEESKKKRKTMLKQEFLEFKEGLHKGYDRFQKILSQLNQRQQKPDNDDVNLKFLRALPSSRYQVALTLKTRGDLEYLSFDDLYNKLRSLEIDVKGGSSYGSRGTIVAPTHSAFVGAASTNTKMVYSDQPSHSSLITYTSAHSGGSNGDGRIRHQMADGCALTKDQRNEHETENKTVEGEQVNGLMARFKLDFADHAGNAAGSVYDAAAEFAIMGISHKAKIEKKEREVELVESLARFDKWKKSSKNLVKLINSSMSTRTKLGLGFKEFIGSDEVFDLSIPSVFDPEPENREVKSLYKSDKSSESKTYDFASCVSSPKTNDSFFTVDVKILPKSDVKDPSPTNGFSSCSFKENVKPPRNLCNKSGIADRIHCKNNFVRTKTCFVCGSKSHLIMDCDVYDNVDNLPSIVSKAASVPAAPFPAGRSVPTGWTNHAARPFFRPTNLYCDNVSWPEIYDHMSMNEGRWGSAVKSSVHPHVNKDIGIVDSGCSRSMTGNKDKLDDFVQVKGGIVTFGCGDGKITGKGTIRTSKLNFENVYYVEELQHFNLFSVSQICNNKNKVLFTDDECLVLTKEFQLPDESQVVLIIPRSHDLYTFNLSDIQPEQHINCVLAKASLEESTKWHRRMVHVNFKTINKLAKNGLVKEAVSTACYVLNRVSITNPHNKTPYELLSGKVPNISHLKPFRYQVTILNTSDHLGKFKGKANEGFLVGYAANSKAYRVYNLSSKKVEETLNLRYLEDKPNVYGLGQEWYFDLDYLTDSLGYTRFKTNTHAGTQNDDSESEYYAEELARFQRQEHKAHSAAEKYGFEFSNEKAKMLHQAEIETLRNLVLAAGDPAGSIVSTGGVPTGSVPAGSIPPSSVPASSVPASSVPAGSVPGGGVLAGSVDSAGFGDPAASESVPAIFNPDHVDNSTLPPGHSLGSSEHSIRFPSPSDLENHQPKAGIFSSSSYDDDFCADTNLASKHSSVAKALEDPDWVAAMQEEMQQFFNQQVWKLVPLPDGKIAIGTKWILKNKRDARGIVVRNKARLVAQGHRQEEGIDYDEVFAPVARIEAIRLFLAFSSYMGFTVYQIDVKSSFLYGEIEEEVYVTQPKGFEDLYNPKHVYRVVKALYGLHQAPRAWYARLSTFLLKHHYRRGTIDKTLFIKKDSRHIILVQVYVDDIIFGSMNKAWCDEFEVLMKGEFKMSAMGELTFFLGLQVKQLPYGIFISQDKYVKDMLKKFDMESMRTATTPYEVPKPKSKDEPDDAFNIHLYRSMIGSLMYLTASRPDIMFAVSACSRHQCKKQTILATSSTEAEYVAAAGCCGQSTICIVKNPVFHQRTKHIEIRHHFIRDANEKNLIQISLSGSPHWDAQSLGITIEGRNKPKGRLTVVSFVPPMLLVVQVFLLVVLVHADGLVPAGSCTIPTGSYSFMLLDWFLLDDHNKVAYLEKGKGWEAYEQILDFLNRSHIRYALSHHPLIVFDSLVKQFWATATVRTLEAGPSEIIATIDGNEVVVTESLIRTQLQLNDGTGLYEFTLNDVLDGMREMGYPTDGSLTFYKAKLSPQWRFFIHTLIHLVPASGDGADAAAAGVAAANEVPPPPPPPPDDSVALIDLSLKLDRCINRVKSLENELGVTKKVLGGAVMKLVSRVKRLEGILKHRKRSMVLSDSEREEAAIKEQEIDLDALHKLARTSLGGDTTVEAAYTIFKASQDAHASSDAGHDEDKVPDTTTVPFRRTRTKRRRLRKTFTSSAFEHFQENISAIEDTIPADDGIPAGTQTIPAGSTPIPTTGGVSAGSSMDPAGQAVATAPSLSAIPAVDKGKSPMVDDSIPADLLTEQEQVLKNLHDYQLGEDLAKKLQAEQEAEFARQQEELAQKAQAKSVALPTAQELMTKIATNSALSKQLLGDNVNEDNMNERLGMLLMRKRRELVEQSRVKPMNKTQQRDFMRDFVKNQSASVYNQVWTMKTVKALSIAQLKHEFEYIQRNLEQSNLLNFKRTTFRPKPTLEAPSAKRARQEVPAASLQVPASVPAAPSIAADVLVSAVSTTTADVSVAPTLPAELPIPSSGSVGVSIGVTKATTTSILDPPPPTTSTEIPHTTSPRKSLGASTHGVESQKDSTTIAFTSGVSHASPSSSCRCRKQIAKKRVTPIEMIPTPFGSIHAYYDMEEHTKHFTSLRQLLHMVEKNDLRKLLGDVDKFYQRQEPETFGLILWGDLLVLFQSLADEDAHAFWRDQESWRIRTWRLYPRAHVHVLETVDRRVIYMFVDVSYPLSEATLERMLRHGLEVPKLLVGGDLTMAEQLVRFIKADLLNGQSAV